jgi:hypothetical protein
MRFSHLHLFHKEVEFGNVEGYDDIKDLVCGYVPKSRVEEDVNSPTTMYVYTLYDLDHH